MNDDLPFPKPKTVILEGPAYWAFKQKLHELDGWRCKICGKITGLTVSHMIKRSQGRLDTVENCYSACVDCHEKVERHVIRVWWADYERRRLGMEFL